MEERKGFRFRFLAAAGIVAALTVAVLIGILIFSGVKEERYKAALKSANAYYTAGDYTNAIAGYESAIQINAKKDKAYLNLATLYLSQGDYDHAGAVIARGLEAAASDALRERDSELKTLIGSVGGGEAAKLLSDAEIAAASEDAAVENTVFDRVASYTYTEYYRDFGTPTSVQKQGEKLYLSYRSAGFYGIYYDLDKEKVLDTKDEMPVATAKPNQVCYESLSGIFSMKGENFAVSKDKLLELFGDQTKFYQDETSGKYYVSAEYKKCRITVQTDASGNIVSETAWNALEPLNRSNTEDEDEDQVEGKTGGYVQDAVKGTGIRATLKIRKRGQKSGEVLKELTSGTDGGYTYGGLAGSYTAEVSAAGYITEYLDLDIIKGQTITGKNVVLSQELAEGEIRIVLTWGSSPADLDSHIEGRSASGQSFHVYYGDRTMAGVAQLDVDDTNGYGPETITVTDTGAEFTYAVVDFNETGTMSSSGAKVKVYLPGGEIKEYSVPAGSGLEWEVFRYQNGELTPINQLH